MSFNNVGLPKLPGMQIEAPIMARPAAAAGAPRPVSERVF